jgi:hypothetical protein
LIANVACRCQTSKVENGLAIGRFCYSCKSGERTAKQLDNRADEGDD